MTAEQTAGLNRTGIAMSPLETAAMLEPTESPSPPEGDVETLFKFRGQFVEPSDVVGTLPPPAAPKGTDATMIHTLKNGRLEVFLDKLGERIAFERTGTRLYDLLINKCHDRADDLPQLPIEMLEAIRRDELHHFRLASAAMHQLGGDPTAVTPAADVAGVMAQGLMQTLADPRTTVPQALEAILLAELADNDAWPMLIDLAEEHGLETIVEEFRKAESAEQRHLAEIRALVSEATLNKVATRH